MREPESNPQQQQQQQPASAGGRTSIILRRDVTTRGATNIRVNLPPVCEGHGKQSRRVARRQRIVVCARLTRDTVRATTQHFSA